MKNTPERAERSGDSGPENFGNSAPFLFPLLIAPGAWKSRCVVDPDLSWRADSPWRNALGWSDTYIPWRHHHTRAWLWQRDCPQGRMGFNSSEFLPIPLSPPPPHRPSSGNLIVVSWLTSRHHSVGNSLVVQWLGLDTFTAGARVQSPVGELRSHIPCSAAKANRKIKHHRLLKTRPWGPMKGRQCQDWP